MAARIVFNGREYASVEEMPADVRRAYEQVMGLLADKDRDGVPDIVQGAGGGSVVVQQTSFNVNGRQYASVEEMPDDVRKLYQRAMGMLESGGGGFQMKTGAAAGEAASGREAAQPPDRRATPSPRWGEEEQPAIRPGMVLLILVVVVAVLVALLR